MGIFWDLIQQSEIQKQSEKSNNLEDRITILEKELEETKLLLRKTLLVLEQHVNIDIDGDGKTGH